MSNPPAVVQAVADLRRGQPLEEQGYEVRQTGGGCTAYVIEADGGEIMITDENGSTHRFEERCLVGLYWDEDRHRTFRVDLRRDLLEELP